MLLLPLSFLSGGRDASRGLAGGLHLGDEAYGLGRVVFRTAGF
jgi:hypothetical protein